MSLQGGGVVDARTTKSNASFPKGADRAQRRHITSKREKQINCCASPLLSIQVCAGSILKGGKAAWFVSPEEAQHASLVAVRSRLHLQMRQNPAGLCHPGNRPSAPPSLLYQQPLLSVCLSVCMLPLFIPPVQVSSSALQQVKFLPDWTHKIKHLLKSCIFSVIQRHKKKKHTMQKDGYLDLLYYWQYTNTLWS